MKRKIALFLSLLTLLTACIPALAFADNSKSLEEAIANVRKRIDIPSEYSEISYSNYTRNGDTIWYLSWSRKDGIPGEISVRVNQEGIIQSYYHYEDYYYNYGKLPKISREQAKANADAFIARANPEIANELAFSDYDYVDSLGDSSYYFTYYRKENGVFFYGDSASVEVDKDTGKVRSFYLSWSDGYKFPSAGKAIDLSKAQEAFREKLGLRLTYNYSYDYENEEINFFLAYQPKFYTNKYIDAYTGSVIEVQNYYIGGGYADAEESVYNSLKKDAGTQEAAYEPTPEELEAIEEISKFITKEQAEKIARDLEELSLTDDFKFSRSRLTRDWLEKTQYTYDLTFEKGERYSEDYESRTISIDARTGEVKGFNVYINHKEDEKPQFTETQAKAAAEALLKKLAPEKFSSCEFDEEYDDQLNAYVNVGEELPKYYYFRYIRKVNDILFPGNSIYICYDAIAGKVISMSGEWFDMELPMPEGELITEDTAYSVFFNEIGLELKYVEDYKDVQKIVIEPDVDVIPDIRLVYDMKGIGYSYIDAITGKLIDYDGKPVAELNVGSYKDIEGHFAEKYIKEMARYGIALPGDEFQAEKGILQKEFLYLLAKCIYYYEDYDLNNSNDLDKMYKDLMKEGIVKDGERADDTVLTREESTKYIIRVMKYEEVAKISGIFNCNFKDAEKIDEELKGYVAIANGLGLISEYEGYFLPDDNLTRLNAILMIYNYLRK